jgi:hypothetical protein
MPIDDLAAVEISLSDPPLGLLDFATPLIAVDLTAPQVSELDGDVTIEVTPASWLTVLDTLGVASGEQAYEALLYLFSQPARPSSCLLGSRSTPVAQVSRGLIATGTYTGVFTATIQGTAVTFNASSSDQDAVATGLRAAINGNATLAARVTASGTGANVDVTADFPGQPFTFLIAGYSGGQVTNSTQTANVGPGEDLALWQAEDPGFYLILEDSRDEQNILTMAAAVEAMGSSSPKLFLAQSLDADANTSATDDIGSQLQDLAYYRTAICSYPDDAVWLDAALAGACISRPPGSITWARRRLTGITGTEYASTTNALAKRYTLLEQYRAAGFAASAGGRVARGTPIDLIIARDAIKNAIQIKVAEIVTSNPKVPYTDDGAELIASAVQATLEEFAAAPYNVLISESIEVEVPRASAQSTTNRGNRHFPGVNWAATAQGAIESIGISGAIKE